MKIVKSYFSLLGKCYEYDYSKIIFFIDNFYGMDCFWNKCFMWLDLEDIGKIRVNESVFRINEINENNRNNN